MKIQKFVLIACLSLCGPALADGDRHRQAFEIRGLEQPAEIIIDQWGVPHIYAATHYDAFLVQGFNAARDRLWQIDTWRRRGLGELSAVFGDTYLEQDRANRLFLYRGGMYREWLAYGSDAKRIAEAFTAGINAYIDLLDEHPDWLPPEFDLLDYRPARWRPEDVVRIRSHGLWGNVEREAHRARIVCASDLETSEYWWELEPDANFISPDGLDPCSIPANVLDTYMLAKAPVSFAALMPTETTEAESEATKGLGRGLGSNNWAVAPSRTSTGRPILADDPHRGHAVPSLRYIAHLNGPGLNVIGAGEPALPGISIGHNDRIAFGLTIFPIDQEDLYVYEVDGNRYRYADGWEAFDTRSETISVKGADPVQVELKFTRHGPVVFEGTAGDRAVAFAVRAAWLEPGMAPYFGSVEYMRASNWREFEAALNRWGAPAENQVFADIDGNIGYKPAGLFPRRPNWWGVYPVPGDGRYEWSGFHDMDVLPVEYNPERGFTGTANSMNLPDDYPIDAYRVAFEWSQPWRYRRLWSVLESQPAHSPDDSRSLQYDYRSLAAERIAASIPDEVAGPAADLLRQWNGTLAADSAPAALYSVWFHRHLMPAFAALLLPDAPDLLERMGDSGMLRLLREQRGRALVEETLARAWDETVSLLGDDPAAWRWGDLHRIRFRHPLLDLARGDLAEQMAMPDYPMGGSGNTTNNTAFRAANFDVLAGASYRQVIDVGNWDASTMTNAPGQSGDPRSPFYANLLHGWANLEAFPLLFSREAVERHAVRVIRLQPIR